MSTGIGVVVTSFRQARWVRQAVASVHAQTLVPDELVVVDDGSDDDESLAVLDELDRAGVRVLRQENQGVSAARNAGIRALRAPLVAVLDGDDRWAPTFLARTHAALAERPEIVAASSWLLLHGVTDGVVRPPGGTAVDFLHRNACPASALLRRERWAAAGGYDEQMRSGFEDWDLFLTMLSPGGRIEVVADALVEYRTAPASANVRSMEQRLELVGHLVDKHRALYERHVREAVLGLEATSIARLDAWERLLVAAPHLPVGEPSYGDGGMAAAVRIASRRTPAGHAPDGGPHLP